MKSLIWQPKPKQPIFCLLNNSTLKKPATNKIIITIYYCDRQQTEMSPNIEILDENAEKIVESVLEISGPIKSESSTIDADILSLE